MTNTALTNAVVAAATAGAKLSPIALGGIVAAVVVVVAVVVVLLKKKSKK